MIHSYHRVASHGEDLFTYSTYRIISVLGAKEGKR